MLLLEKICECSNDTAKCCSTVKETPNHNQINTEPNILEAIPPLMVGVLLIILISRKIDYDKLRG